MTLAALPSTAAYSRRDPYVDYASNLAGFANALVDDPAYLAGIDPDYLRGLEGAEDSVNVIGLIANAAMGAFVIPSLMRRMRNGGPVPNSSILLGAVIGGALGWWKPLPTTLFQSAALILDI